MNELIDLQITYQSLLSQLQFDTGDLDYQWFETQIPLLDQLADLDHSAISIFDLSTKKHIYASNSFATLFNIDSDHALSTEEMDARIHPEDRLQLLKIGVKSFQFFFDMEGDDLMHYKLINEYRLRGINDQYVRVVEQHKAFATAKNDKLWLSLSMVDLSPNQNTNLSVLHQVVNVRTGENFAWEDDADRPQLTARESQVLGLVKRGLLSKEISHHLNISVHTVNTHRQRILDKMSANNAQEAIQIASRFGMI